MDLDTRQQMVLRIAVLIVISTVILTASFFGVIAAASGEISGLDTRMPFYLLASAMVFVSTIVLLEFYDTDGKTIITSALFSGISALVLSVFSVEGVIFAANNPDNLIVNQLVVYFVAAALVATGVGFWALEHWREFTEDYTNSL